jgi:hypothetical protein
VLRGPGGASIGRRYDAITFTNSFGQAWQAVLWGVDADNDCEFDEIPDIVEYASSNPITDTDFTWGEVTPYEHKCPDGKTISCCKVAMKAKRTATIIVTLYSSTTTHIIKICPCDCVDKTGRLTQATSGTDLPEG